MFLSFAQQFFLQFSSIHLNRDHEFSLKGFETNRTITNASEYCHHILFDTPGLSREDPPQFSKGLCPDTWSTFYTTLFFLIIYTLSVSFGIFGVIWKRKNGFITSRNPSHMILTMSIGYLFALLLALRFLIGRKIFPCALYTITFFTVPAALCLPTVLRLARLHFMYRNHVVESPEISKMFKKLKIYSFLVSNKFIVLVNVIVMTITIAIWLLFGVIEEAIYNTNGDPNKERVILIEGGMLVFSQGCSMNINTVIIVVVKPYFSPLLKLCFSF
ncbi:hypothetical protein C9374_008341 [Naegleria lovaniensis]|uniref:Uncharacterized protein n=1 Tax=Naegleria lovaniensis TaxID=51637 RepID=A0AA88GGN9_NAELO|nr:uncharacterized protein C9374_008341 [Naegleria lovaniensis]KAG2378198.1 hypothetical protein C9374_008341 [Naegleria lovaniensis]